MRQHGLEYETDGELPINLVEILRAKDGDSAWEGLTDSRLMGRPEEEPLPLLFCYGGPAMVDLVGFDKVGNEHISNTIGLYL